MITTPHQFIQMITTPHQFIQSLEDYDYWGVLFFPNILFNQPAFLFNHEDCYKLVPYPPSMLCTSYRFDLETRHSFDLIPSVICHLKYKISSLHPQTVYNNRSFTQLFKTFMEDKTHSFFDDLIPQLTIPYSPIEKAFYQDKHPQSYYLLNPDHILGVYPYTEHQTTFAYDDVTKSTITVLTPDTKALIEDHFQIIL